MYDLFAHRLLYCLMICHGMAPSESSSFANAETSTLISITRLFSLNLKPLNLDLGNVAEIRKKKINLCSIKNPKSIDQLICCLFKEFSSLINNLCFNINRCTAIHVVYL